MEKIILRRWTHYVGKIEYCFFSNGKLTPCTGKQQEEIISGGYASYREGLFCAWMKDETLYLFWKGLTYEINKTDKVEWVNSVIFRELTLLRNDKELLSFKYLTFIRYFKDYILNVIFMDDDWGWFNDFPSFVESNFRSNVNDNLIKWANHI